MAGRQVETFLKKAAFRKIISYLLSSDAVIIAFWVPKLFYAPMRQCSPTLQRSNAFVAPRRSSTVTIVGKEVGASWPDIGNHATRAQSLDSLAKRRRGSCALERNEVSSQTGNVRASHALQWLACELQTSLGNLIHSPSSTDGAGSSVASNPGRQNVGSWGEDVDGVTKVGEGRAVVVDVSGTDGASRRLRGWGDVAGVLVLVSGSDSDEDTSTNGGSDSIVEDLTPWATERQGEYTAADTAAASIVDSLFKRRGQYIARRLIRYWELLPSQCRSRQRTLSYLHGCPEP